MKGNGYHFFIERNGGEWHRTEATDTEQDPASCSCGISVRDERVIKVSGHVDNSWMFAPPGHVGKCFKTADPRVPQNAGGAVAAGPFRVLTVILEREFGDDEIEVVTDAIAMIKGVAEVQREPLGAAGLVARAAVRIDIERDVMEAVHSAFEGKPWTPERR